MPPNRLGVLRGSTLLATLSRSKRWLNVSIEGGQNAV